MQLCMTKRRILEKYIKYFSLLKFNISYLEVVFSQNGKIISTHKEILRDLISKILQGIDSNSRCSITCNQQSKFNSLNHWIRLNNFCFSIVVVVAAAVFCFVLFIYFFVCFIRSVNYFWRSGSNECAISSS